MSGEKRRITKREVVARLKGLDTDRRKAMVCALVGHSRIMEHFWGYWNCARCGAQVGDSLGGAFDGSNAVIVGHNCKTCRKNAKVLTWRDTFLAPKPFERTASEQPTSS